MYLKIETEQTAGRGPSIGSMKTHTGRWALQKTVIISLKELC